MFVVARSQIDSSITHSRLTNAVNNIHLAGTVLTNSQYTYADVDTTDNYGATYSYSGNAGALFQSLISSLQNKGYSIVHESPPEKRSLSDNNNYQVLANSRLMSIYASIGSSLNFNSCTLQDYLQGACNGWMSQ